MGHNKNNFIYISAPPLPTVRVYVFLHILIFYYFQKYLQSVGICENNSKINLYQEQNNFIYN